MSGASQDALVALSRWIDAGNAHRDPEALTLHRLVKITEEAGEVVSATIGALGANPRKGVTNTFEGVLEELLDVAVTALGAYEHIDGHQGRALAELEGKILRVAERVGVVTRTRAADGSEVVIRTGDHVLIADSCGDPSCVCGFKPVPPAARTQMHAVSLIRSHVREQSLRPVSLCPECRDGKCGNCIGEAMTDADEMVPCECPNHHAKGGL